MKITHINVISIYVTDLETAKDFYISKLGFEDCENMAPGILLKSNYVTIYLEPGREPKNDAPTRHCTTAPCFAIKHIKRSYEELKKLGVYILMDYTEYGPTYAMFSITDPDGNVLEFAGQP